MTDIQTALFALRDPAYQAFQSKLIPTIDPQTVIGVRMPALRKLAREIAGTPVAEGFLQELPHRYYEENNLHGLLISAIPDYDGAVAALETFLPYVDNWATCDLLSPKAFRKHPPELRKQIRRWVEDAHTYTVRFGLGMLMSFYLDEGFQMEDLDLAAGVRREEYYSGYEHNAVTRPLAALGAQVSVAAAPLFQPAAVTAAFDRLIVPGTDAVICNHVSNVFGFVQPVEAIAAICREREVPFIIDASQSAGMLTLDMTALGAAFIAMPGHKGLYGPQGTGVLLCGKDVPVRTLLEGGTGSISIQQEMPDFLPDRLEAGTHNMPGIAGLLAGVRFVRQLGPEAICAGERQLTFQAAEGLRRLPGLQVFALPDLAAQAGVLSIVPEHMDAEALGAALADRGIAVRAGLHCAPLAHRTAGTLDTGTVRLSFSHWNTREEVSRFLVAMGEILR